jgi:hypothetical protein
LMYIQFQMEQFGLSAQHRSQLFDLIGCGKELEIQQLIRSFVLKPKAYRMESSVDPYLLASYRLCHHNSLFRDIFLIHIFFDEVRSVDTIHSFLIHHYTDSLSLPLQLNGLRDTMMEIGFGTGWIRWLVHRISRGDDAYDRMLQRESVEQSSSYHQVMLGCYGIEYVILYKHVLGQEHASKSVHKLERSFSDVMLDLFSQRLGERRQTYVYAFLAGRWPLDLLIDRLRQQIPSNIGGQFPFQRYLWLRNEIPQFDRALQLLWIGDDYRSLLPVFDESIRTESFDQWMSWMESLNVAHHQLLSLCLFAKFQEDRSVLVVASEAWIDEQWRNHSDLLLANWASFPVKARVYFISQWMEHDRERMAPMLEHLTQDRSKRVRRLFEQVQPYHELWQSMMEEEAEPIQELLDPAEDSALQPARISRSETVTPDIVQLSANGDELVSNEWISRKSGERGRPKRIVLDWVKWSALPVVYQRDGLSPVPESLLRSAMIVYAKHSSMELQEEACSYFEQMQSESLKDWIWQLFLQWLEDGAETKKKWVMVLAVLHGDHRVIDQLTIKLDEWPRHSRGTIAIDAMKAMAITNRDEVLIHLAIIAQESKIRQIRTNAKEILEQFAESQQLDRELFYDRLIPTHGFNSARERYFDYGPRSFRAKLNHDLQFELTDHWNKPYKAMPLPAKNDDPIRSQYAWDAMKWLRRQLPLTVSRQQERLQQILVFPRYWSSEDWKQKMVMHPIMHSFACGLLWGWYRNGQLIRPFVYLDGEDIAIESDAVITVVHPVELDAIARSTWQQRVHANKVSELIHQFDRYLDWMNQVKLPIVNSFEGQSVRADRLRTHLEARGWQMGSLQERGQVFTFFRENDYNRVGVQLAISGMSITDTHQLVTLDTVRFYQAGKIVRGHYHSDEIPQGAELHKHELPIRTWYECLTDIYGLLDHYSNA